VVNVARRTRSKAAPAWWRRPEIVVPSAATLLAGALGLAALLGGRDPPAATSPSPAAREARLADGRASSAASAAPALSAPLPAEVSPRRSARTATTAAALPHGAPTKRAATVTVGNVTTVNQQGGVTAGFIGNLNQTNIEDPPPQ
jgi:hypothetical protein